MLNLFGKKEDAEEEVPPPVEEPKTLKEKVNDAVSSATSKAGEVAFEYVVVKPTKAVAKGVVKGVAKVGEVAFNHMVVKPTKTVAKGVAKASVEAVKLPARIIYNTVMWKGKKDKRFKNGYKDNERFWKW